MLITVIQVFEISFPNRDRVASLRLGGGGGAHYLYWGRHKTLFRTNSLKF